MESVKKIALLFPGQGAQAVGMAQDFFDESAKVRELFALASDVVGMDMQSLLFTGDGSRLKETINTQPAITLANLAAFTILREQGLQLEQVVWGAGFSLGEYAALAAAEVVTTAEVFGLVKVRGEIMHKHGELYTQKYGKPGMAAVVGLSAAEVLAVLAEQTDVYVANHTAPLQVVISGSVAAIERMEPLLKEAGAKRVIPLAVSGPFHTPLLSACEDEFKEVLKGCDFKKPKFALYSNVTGAQAGDDVDWVDVMSRQISHPVLWTSVLEHALNEHSASIALECGPGQVLSGLMRAKGSELEVCLAGKMQDLVKVKDYLNHKEN